MTISSSSFMEHSRERLFGVSPVEASFAQRGFPPAAPDRQRRLEAIGETFLLGYNRAVRDPRFATLTAALETVPAPMRGFAYEGAGMGLAILDLTLPLGAGRLRRFIEGPGTTHCYMMYVGAGLALARVTPRLAWRLGPLDPLLRWLTWDGFGFHEGYFNADRAIVAAERPAPSRDRRREVFDQGIGRAMWFMAGAEPVRVHATIAGFPMERHADLWSGVGLAAAYAGGATRSDLDTLRDLAGPFHPHLMQGVCFAAIARHRAGNPARHTDLAAAMLCGRSVAECAAIVDATHPTDNTPDDGTNWACWRAAIRERLTVSIEQPAEEHVA